MAVIETWNANRLEQVSEMGRTRPLILRCRRTASIGKSKPATKHVKALGLPEVTQRMLVCEVAGNAIARQFGVPTPEPCIVEISPDAAARINDDLNRNKSGLSIQAGDAAGCEYLRGGMASMGARQPLGAAQEEQARLIYVFDQLAQNPERVPLNPNCGAVPRGLVAFDFGDCFSHLWLPIIGGTGGQAWEITKHGLFNRHLFFGRLRGKLFDPSIVEKAILALTDSWWGALEESFPVYWRSDLVLMKQYVISIRDHATEFAEQIQWSLA